MMIETIIVAVVTSIATTLGAYALAASRTRREFLLQYKAESVAIKILSHPKWKWRTFKVISHHLGGFENDELRKILVQCGAVRFETKEGEEIWGLFDRVVSELESPRYPLIEKAFTVADTELDSNTLELVKGFYIQGDENSAMNTIRAATGLSKNDARGILDRYINSGILQ